MVVGADDLDVVAHDVEHAAALQAGRKLIVDEANRNLNADAAVLADAHEVDVDRLILDGIDLQVARDDAAFLAFDDNLDDGRGEVALEHLLPEVVVVEGDGLGRLAVTVDDSWNFSFTTSLACGPLAGTWARRGLQLDRLLSHGWISKKIRALRPADRRGLQGCRAPSHAEMLEMARVIAVDQEVGNCLGSRRSAAGCGGGP